jgi:hypothetical protein
MNSKEESSKGFYLDFVQELGLWTWTVEFVLEDTSSTEGSQSLPKPPWRKLLSVQ